MEIQKKITFLHNISVNMFDKGICVNFRFYNSLQ